MEPPTYWLGGSMYSGRLPPYAIKYGIHLKFGIVRACYERGLVHNPNLRGRVVVRFVINRDGSVRTAEDAGSDLPDPEVVACVLRAYRSFQFPASEWGIVTVTYPIVFSPE
jgi:TonB family protein